MAETTDLVGTAAAAIRLHFPEFRDAPAREWQHFVAVLTPRQFGKGEFLQRQGTPADRLFFLVSGVVCLRHQRDGEAINLGFDRENRFVAACASVLTGEPATFGIVALEPCIAVQLLAADLRGLYERHPCWERIGRLLAERSFLSPLQETTSPAALSGGAKRRSTLVAAAGCDEQVEEGGRAAFVLSGRALPANRRRTALAHRCASRSTSWRDSSASPPRP